MRTLKTETAGLPAGTKYDVYESFGAIRVRWVGNDKLTRGRRIDGGRMPPPFDALDIEARNDSSLDTARAVHRAHLVALGINDGAEAPCANCGDVIGAGLTVCPSCKADPDAQVPCLECDREPDGTASGYIDYAERGGLNDRREVCFACEGRKVVDGGSAGQRENALAAVRARKAAQAVEQVPAGTTRQRPTAET